MSNLSNRVQKSKTLKFNFVRKYNDSITYGTTSHNHEHHYQVVLQKARETSPFGDKQMSHDTITVNCYQYHQPVKDCPGNSHHTVCYHGLGAIRYHLGLKDVTISFCQDIFDAIKLRKPGQSLVKIVSGQGEATLWGVVSKKQIRVIDESSLLKAELTKSADIHFNTPAPSDILQERINLLRGPANEQNGID